MSYYDYCPYCGKVQFSFNTVCSKCLSAVGLLESKNDTDYYRNKSLEQYGDYTHWYEFLEPEIRESPLFDEEKFNHVVTEEEYAERRKGYAIPTYQPTQPQNIPTCPTCGSTNIKKISDLNRVTSVALFGLASSKIGKQFECKNCGYKVSVK